MKTATQLKANLIDSIRQINDLDFLLAIQTILDSSDKGFFKLSAEQKRSIGISREQIKKGKFRNNESVLSDVKKWLKSE
jgi:hypothetical protein